MIYKYPYIHPAVSDCLQDVIQSVLLVLLISWSYEIYLRRHPPTSNVYILDRMQQVMS